MTKKIYRYYVDKDKTRTVSIRSKKTGRMLGRRKAKKFERSDQILNIRVKEPKSVSGQIHGFLPKGKKSYPVRGSSSKRGTLRKRL